MDTITDYLSSDESKLHLDNLHPDSLEAAVLSLVFRPKTSIFLSDGQKRKELRIQPQNNYCPKTILFIPANGRGKIHDFSLFRIAKKLQEMNYSCVILTLDPIDAQFQHLFSKIYKVTKVTDFFSHLCNIPYSKILYRGWMHAYTFGAFLSQSFRNVILNIKDWNFSSINEYTFLFGEKSSFDFEAIKVGFQNAESIISHYTKEEYLLWAEQYNVSPDKFHFIPEFCNRQNFHSKSDSTSQFPHIVFAGTLPPSSYPEEFFLTKGYLRTIKKNTNKKVLFSCVVPERYFKKILENKPLYSDLMYENRFSNNFSLCKGKDLDPSILDPFHFGHFMLEYTTRSQRLNRYAVPSKVAFYMEAGLPLLVNQEMRSVARLTRENNIGIVYSNDDLSRIDEILNISEAEYRILLENVKTFRELFRYDHNELDKIFGVNDI